MRLAHPKQFCLAITLVAAACLKLKSPATPPPPQYMYTSDRYELLDVPETTTPSANFILDHAPFCFAGTNNYYLIYKSPRMVDDVFAEAERLDLKVMRTWAFMDRGSLDGTVQNIDGDGTKDGVYFQYWDKVSGRPAYNDGANGLKKLDYVLHKARETGIKMILVLTNNWAAFGGMDQYLLWYGLDKHHLFYTDPRVRQAYKDWVAHLVAHKNSIDGTRYGSDPAIFAWELANEPRCLNDSKRDSRTGWTSHTLTDWADEMSGFLKAIDPNHLVAVGDEGFLNGGRNHWTYQGYQCVDHKALLALPHVDFGTFHLYPDVWGTGYRFGYDWIRDHIAVAQELGKPTVLEEYGIPVKRDQTTFEVTQGWKRRETAYRNWNNLMLKRGGNASIFWMLAGVEDSGKRYPDYDHYTVYGGMETATLLSEYAARFNTSATACQLAPPMTATPASPFVSVTTRERPR